jgi:hypothetical protein
VKPEEYDVVRVVRRLPDGQIPAGAEGTIVMVLTAKGLFPMAIWSSSRNLRIQAIR